MASNRPLFKKQKIQETKDEKSNTLLLSRSYHFKKKASCTYFGRLHPDLVNCIIFPMLSVQDVSRLMQAGQEVHQLFRKPFGEVCLKQLLQYVVYGNQKKVEAMLKKHPLLLLHKDTVTDYSGRKIKGTAYQMALGAEDIEMAEMIQDCLMNLPEGGKPEIVKQQNEQFPPDEKKAKKKKISPEINALYTITQIIRDAKNEEIKVDDHLNIYISEKCQTALAQFRSSLEPKGVITTGKHFNSTLLLKAFQLYERHYDDFGGSWGSPKNMLFWRQVIGYIQRFFPACYVQFFCQGTEYSLKLRRRSFLCRYNTDITFFPLDSNSRLRLGYEFAAGYGGIPGGGGGGGEWDDGWSKLFLSKQSRLAELMQHPGRQWKNICLMM